MKRIVLLFAAVFAVALVLATAWADNEKLDFNLVNATGYGIKEIYVAPSASTEWGDSIISKPLENNESLAISFNENATAEKWDLKIVWVDGGDAVYWKGVKLTEINKITLHYNRESGETSASAE